MFYVVVGLLVVAALIVYGDRIQRREKREQAAQHQRLVVDLVVPAVVERVKAELEAELAEKWGDAIADVQDAILASLSQVIREAVERDSVDVS